MIKDKNIKLERDEKENIWTLTFEILITENCNIIESIKDKKLFYILADVNKVLIEKVELLSENEELNEEDYVIYFNDIEDGYNKNIKRKLYLILNTKIYTEENRATLNFLDSSIELLLPELERIAFTYGNINIDINENNLKFKMIFQFIEINSEYNVIITYLLRKMSYKFKNYLEKL